MVQEEKLASNSFAFTQRLYLTEYFFNAAFLNVWKKYITECSVLHRNHQDFTNVIWKIQCLHVALLRQLKDGIYVWGGTYNSTSLTLSWTSTTNTVTAHIFLPPASPADLSMSESYLSLPAVSESSPSTALYLPIQPRIPESVHEGLPNRLLCLQFWSSFQMFYDWGQRVFPSVAPPHTRAPSVWQWRSYGWVCSAAVLPQSTVSEKINEKKTMRFYLVLNNTMLAVMIIKLKQMLFVSKLKQNGFVKYHAPTRVI